MIDLLCAIPEELGWALVGALALLTLQMGCKLVKFIINANKEEEK